MKHFKHVHFTFNISEGSQISPVTPEVTSRNYEINETTVMDKKLTEILLSGSLIYLPSIFIQNKISKNIL